MSLRPLLSSRFVRRAVLVLALLQAAVSDLGAREDWTVLKNCRFIPNPADDGDSFHASADGVEYIFRLCLVDAPETAATDPARLIEQAKYFEITVPQAIEVGNFEKFGGQAKKDDSSKESVR